MSKENSLGPESGNLGRDLSLILKDAPPGAWAALSGDESRLLGTGETMMAASLQAHLKGERHPVLVKMPFDGEGIAARVR
jgi:hypothetical protein